MCSNNTTQKTNFWKFLSFNTIEIPIVQRDYAQGRLGKEYLRKSFLADIKNALDSGVEMKMDFVYGSVENGKLSPLDGQQRLTTLWLLHWYIALMSGNLSENVCETLKKFTYETRISSREFCQKLCNPNNFVAYKEYRPTEKRKIVDYITRRTWFYSAWKQDPTIQSMLRMLGGTEINDKGGKDIVDGFEELFEGTTIDKFADYWKALTETDVIVFYQLPLENFGLSDDLYIKMNARGKQLTSFENFKADLIGYIREKKWENLLHPTNGIPIKMDTTWTDIFWRNKSDDNKIDEIYFSFLNRFFLCQLLCQKEETGEYCKKIDDTPSFNYLYGNEGNDSNIYYEDFGKYRYFNGEIPSSSFDSLKAILDNYTEDPNKYFPKWVKTDFQFIPKYQDKTISTLKQKERVVFLSVCRYLEKGQMDVTSFKQWMRVVWNIVENAGIETVPSMIGISHLIDELSAHSRDIYSFLAAINYEDINSKAAEDQIKEEIAKAKQILKGKPRSDGKSWEEIIIEAEKQAFFKGAIRFMFTNEKGEITEDSWGQFDKKWENAQMYFDEYGVKDCEVAKYRTQAILLKAVLYHVKDFWNYIEPQKFVFDNEASTWKKNILLEQGWEKAVHEILIGNLNVIERNDDCLMYKNLYRTRLLDYIANEQVGSRIRWIHGHRAIYPPRYEGVLLDDENRENPFYRNKVLSLLSDRIRSKQSLDCNYFHGWDIDFVYFNDKGCFDFQWNTDEKVYLIENGSAKTKTSDSNDYFCISVESISDEKELQNKLDCLIAQAYPDEYEKTICNNCQEKFCEHTE